jgi:catechol 2,3-dioxygenase-like lactoylglutathione lyase family enzyme
MPETATPRTPARLEGACPILKVRNLQASIDFYVGVLGFKVNWHHPGVMAGVSRDRAHVMLCEGDQGKPGTWVWFGVDDCAMLFEEYLPKGASIRLPPTNYPWSYEMHVEDPDGHVLRFGSEPKEDRPFSEWVVWYRSENQQGPTAEADA